MRKGYAIVALALLAFGIFLIADGASALTGGTATTTGGGSSTTTTTATTTTTNSGVVYTTATSTTNVCNTCGTSGLQVLPPTGSYSSYAGAPFYFSIAASGGQPAYTYTWTFGDGSTSGPTQGPTGASVSHTYTGAGTYQASVKAEDADGAVAFGYYSVVVSPQPSGSSILVVYDFVQQGPYTNPGTYPIPGASATLTGPGGYSSSQVSSSGGQAAFTLSASGSYTLTVSASGYKTFTQTYDFTKNTVVPPITLTPSCYPGCGLSAFDYLTGANVSPIAEIVMGVISLIVALPVAYVGKD